MPFHLDSNVTVILPSYKKANEIVPCILAIKSNFASAQIPVEILVVIDGDIDQTERKLRAAELDVKILIHTSNQGKGKAIKTGLEACETEYCAFFDADLDIHPDVLVRQYLVLKNNPDYVAVIANKQHPESHLEYPLYRKILSRGLWLLQRVLFRLDFKDTQTGAKTFQTVILRSVVETSSSSGFLFDLEVLYRLRKKGHLVVDCPVDISHKFNSTVKISSVFSLVLELLKLRLILMSASFRVMNSGVRFRK